MLSSVGVTSSRRAKSRSSAWPSLFFPAEDGIRDTSVTGVQTCALPIFVGAVEADQGRAARDALVQARPAPLVVRLPRRDVVLDVHGRRPVGAHHEGDLRLSAVVAEDRKSVV